MAAGPGGSNGGGSQACDEGPPEKRSRLLASYDVRVLHSPLPTDLHEQVSLCMREVFGGDFATNGFEEDQRARMAEPGSVYAVAVAGGAVVATAMISWDGSVGLLGGVCTRPAHRRRGLCRELVGRAVAEVSTAPGGPRWIVLGTGARSSARIYAALGFQGFYGGLEGGAKGYNPDDEGEWMMVRDAESPHPRSVEAGNVPFDLASYVVPGEVDVEPLSRRHWAAGTLLLTAGPGTSKLRAFGVDDGLNAELRLAQAVRDGDAVKVAVHRETHRIYGIAYHDATSGLEVYSVGPPSVAAALAAAATSPPLQAALAAAGGALSVEQRAEFWERGYLVFPGLFAQEAAGLRSRLSDLLASAPAGRMTADWNAVNSGGAEFVLATDDQGQPIPGRVMKVQAAALASPAVLEALASPKIAEAVRGLYAALGQEVPEHVDVFGTKFFPMWPGGTSVSWHQDCHYFGTSSPRIISCGIYLEDTDEENGCLQVIPGSHTRGTLPHEPGAGAHAQGEWASVDASAAADVVVPAGSVVLFNAMLVHGARRNRHSSRTRFSLFGHFVPASLSFGWRGTDFSHGVYPDRHKVY